MEAKVFVIRSEQNLLGLVALVLLALAGIIRASYGVPLSALEWKLYVPVCALFSYLAIRSYLQSKASIHIDRDCCIVTVHSYNWLLQRTTDALPLSIFVVVFSHLTFGKFPKNVVSLLTEDGQRLDLFHGLAGTTAESFFSTPKLAESPKGRAIREALSVYSGLRDLGFRPKQVGHKKLRVK